MLSITTPIEKKLLTYLGYVFLVLIVLVFLVYKGVHTMTRSSDMVKNTLRVQGEVKELALKISQLGENAREYYLTGDSRNLNSQDNAKQELISQIRILRDHISNNPAQVQRLDQLESLVEQKLAMLDTMHQARQNQDLDLIPRLLGDKQLFQVRNDISRTLSSMEQEEQRLYEERSRKQTMDARLAAAIAVTGILVATALLGLTGIGLRREIAKQLENELKLMERDQTLRLTLSVSNAGLWFWDLRDNQITWSDENYRMFGYEPGKCVPSYSLWAGRMHPEDRAYVKQEMETAVEEKRSFNTEYRIDLPNGETRRLLVKGQAEYDDKGRPVRISGINLDVTEFKATEDALYESEERFRQIAENIDAVLWIINAQTGKLEFISSGTKRLWGIDAETLTRGAARWSDYIHPDDQENAITPARENLMSEPLDQEYRIVTPDGRLCWVRDRAFPVKDQRGSIQRIVGFTVDTTERKRADEERASLLASEQEARAQAELASRTKDEFLAIVSHELRSPLNAMLGWARVLRSENIDQQTHDHAVQVIEQSAEMQSRLIEDLLDSARIVSGKLRIEPRPVNLIPAIQAAIDTVRPTVDSKNIQVQTNLDPAASLITGDAERIQQIVWNVLSNAAKFTPKGGRIEVDLKKQELWATIAVKDSGCGISARDLPHIFDRFRQSDSSTTRRAGGLGLGLSLVKKLVELHGGSISAESPGEGLGSTFTVNLPLRTLGTPLSAAPKAFVHGIRDGNGPISFPPVLTGLHILSVDDETQARELIAMLLTKYGASVTTAASSAEAMQILTKNGTPESGFDLIVSDIGMPDENGYTLIRRIRQLPEPINQIPAVALTAFGRAEDRINALEAGFQMHVPKPVEPAELMMVIASLTGRPIKAPPEMS